MTDSENIVKKLESLKHSQFRSKFHLSEKDDTYIHEKGLETIREHAVDFITTRVAPKYPGNDGKQTPMKNHPVFIAQHATATCCRGCVRKWHKIPEDRALDEREIQYLVAIIMAWIEEQMVRFARKV